MQKKRATLWLNAALFLAVAALGYGLTIYFDGASDARARGNGNHAAAGFQLHRYVPAKPAASNTSKIKSSSSISGRHGVRPASWNSRRC
jgi:hypothetical protein